MNAPIQRNQTRECECGTPKRRGSPACERCRFLDGQHANYADVIAVLRGTDGMSVSEVAKATGRGRRSAFRVLKQLLASGRVRRYEGFAEFEFLGRMGGGQALSEQWVYQLWG
jgi:hypothetical protein